MAQRTADDLTLIDHSNYHDDESRVRSSPLTLRTVKRKVRRAWGRSTSILKICLLVALILFASGLLVISSLHTTGEDSDGLSTILTRSFPGFNVSSKSNNDSSLDKKPFDISKSEPAVFAERRFVAPNEILKSTAIGVKTFNRPQCLQEFIASVRLFAPYMMIIVVDDSDQDSRMIFLQGQDQGDVYVMLPTDSGTGFGRNRIVESVHKAGYEYLIMADDDFKLASMETLPMMAKHLVETGADVVAATRCDHTIDNCKRNKGMIVIDEQRNLTIVPNITVYPYFQDSPTCFRSDLVQQFFMARTKTLLKVHWDDHLKNNDHYDFLLSAKSHQLSLVTCSDLLVLHEKTCESLSLHSDTYHEVREGRWFKLLPYIFQKWNLRYIHDEVGKILWVKGDGVGVAKDSITYRYPTASNESRELVTRASEVVNAWLPGWEWIRPLFTKKTWAMRKEFGPCINLISGSMDYEYDRYVTYNNKKLNTSFNQFMYNETCPLAEKFWEVKHHENLDKHKHVYYVTAVAEDNGYLMRLLNVLHADETREDITLVVVVMDKTSKTVLEKNTRMVGLEVVIVEIGPPFSRSIGLRFGFQKARDLARERNHVGAIGFSIDTSILLPPDFSQRIRQNTICGVSGFVPIVYKCISCNQGDMQNMTDGFWVNAGFGMAALCFEDYTRIGGWSTQWGYRWGGEDVDIMERMMKQMTLVVRSKEPGYIYVRDAAVKKLNPGYYKSRNLFPHQLPPASLTRTLSNENLQSRLLNYIKNNISEFSQLDLQIDTFSRTYGRDAKELLYHIILSNRQDVRDKRVVVIRSVLSPVL